MKKLRSFDIAALIAFTILIVGVSMSLLMGSAIFAVCSNFAAVLVILIYEILDSIFDFTGFKKFMNQKR